VRVRTTTARSLMRGYQPMTSEAMMRSYDDVYGFNSLAHVWWLA